MQLAAQSALIGVSTADLYPSISLLGSIGLSATSLSSSARSLTWGIGPSLVWNVFDQGRLTNTVLLQDARFQQLYEQYQDAVLRAAREVDDAAVSFARTREQIVLLDESVKAAQRSLDIATLQYREGLTDFQRVLDSQRSLFLQQDSLVSDPGRGDAEPGGDLQGDGRRLGARAKPPRRRRRDARNHGAPQRLERHPGCAAAAARCPSHLFRNRQDHEPRIRSARAERAHATRPVAPAEPIAAVAPPQPPPKPGGGSRVGAIIVLVLIVFSLTWYFVSDRLTPHTSQARVQAFVVPVAAEVAGQVLKVHVKNNDEVQAGQALFDIDPEPYRITLQRSRSDYETVRRSFNASGSTVEAAQGRAAVSERPARLRAAGRETPRADLCRRSGGDFASPRPEFAGQPSSPPVSQKKAAEADLQKAREGAGERSENNAQLISARSAVEKAELDLKRTKVVAPSRGRVTDLRIDVGQYAQPGAAAMTLIAVHDLWIERRDDGEQPRQHQARRPCRHRARRHAGRGAEGPRAQRRRRGRDGSAGPGRCAAQDREQPRLAAPGAALSGGGRVRSVRARAARRGADRRPGRRAGLHGRPSGR